MFKNLALLQVRFECEMLTFQVLIQFRLMSVKIARSKMVLLLIKTTTVIVIIQKVIVE